MGQYWLFFQLFQLLNGQISENQSWECPSYLDPVNPIEVGHFIPGKWSFMVNVAKKCRGALISKRYVITSPSCCRDKIGEMVYFKTGRKRDTGIIIMNDSYQQKE